MINKQKKKKAVSLSEKWNRKGYLFILPWFFGLVLFFLKPFFETFIFSVNTVSISENGLNFDFAGIDYYFNAFRINPDYLPTLTNSLMSLIFDVPLIIVFSLFAATLISNKFKGITLVRAIFFLPIIYGSGFILSLQQTTVISSTEEMSSVMVSSEQILETIRMTLGEIVVLEYVFAAVDRVFDVVVRSSVQILIFLTALKSVSQSYFEAARVDGASSWDVFWSITIPVVSPYIYLNTIYTIIDSFTHSNNQMIRLIYYISLERMNYSLGSAMAFAYFALILIFILIVTIFMRNKITYIGGRN